ncbi:MAG: hypothetical protein GX076_02050 [Clostridiales bacterium]|nr:hypothetical protein [Clostridiales bacterium]
MDKDQLYAKLKDYLKRVATENDLMKDKVLVKGRVLSNKEAIGNPTRQDYPLLKGKEKLLQAEFKGCCGQAFTDSPGNFQGTLSEFLERPLESNFERASFVAVLNAVMRHLNLIDGTIHCKDDEPEECAKKIVDHIKQNYGNPRVAMIGLQPAILAQCSSVFKVRLVDLDPDNIGTIKSGVLIEDADTNTKEVLEWADLVLVTGSTVANGTIVNFLELDKPTIFYGTSIAGTAKILGVDRFCVCSS